MPRLCERPGCSTPADVAYGFDADTQVVWLDAFEAAQGSRAGALCRRHADAMVVPLGWMLDDRRDPVPRLFNRARMDDLTDGMSRLKARRGRSDKTIELLRSAVLQLTLDELSRDDMVRSGGVHELDPAARAADTPETPEVAETPVVETREDEAPVAVEEPVVEEPVVEEPVVEEPVVEEPVVVPLAPTGIELDQSGPMAIVLALVGDETDASEIPDASEVPDADGAQVLPWQPRFDTDDDLEGVLKPRGRLLSRAFRGITADGA